jgi:hypothetical protein
MHRTARVAAALLPLSLALLSCAGTDGPSPDRQAKAESVCRQAVETKLGSGTATFTGEKATATNYGFKFTGTVSAGSVTKEYVCSADENGADNWIAEGISFS